MLGEQLEDHVVDGEHRGHPAQWGQQMLGGVKELRSRHQPIEPQARHLAQPHGHPPRLIASPHSAGWHPFQALRRPAIGQAVVKEGKALRMAGYQRPGQVAGVAADARLGVHGRRHINVDGHIRFPKPHLSAANPPSLVWKRWIPVFWVLYHSSRPRTNPQAPGWRIIGNCLHCPGMPPLQAPKSCPHPMIGL